MTKIRTHCDDPNCINRPRVRERGSDDDPRQIVADLISAGAFHPDNEQGLRMMTPEALIKLRDDLLSKPKPEDETPDEERERLTTEIRDAQPTFTGNTTRFSLRQLRTFHAMALAGAAEADVDDTGQAVAAMARPPTYIDIIAGRADDWVQMRANRAQPTEADDPGIAAMTAGVPHRAAPAHRSAPTKKAKAPTNYRNGHNPHLTPEALLERQEEREARALRSQLHSLAPRRIGVKDADEIAAMTAGEGWQHAQRMSARELKTRPAA